MAGRLACRLILLASLLMPVSQGHAQSGDAVVSDTWKPLVAEAGRLVDGGTANETAIDDLRAELTESRSTLLSRETELSQSVSETRAALEDIGPAPEDGPSEPESLRDSRDRLNQQLAAAQVDLLATREALEEVNAAIASLDGYFRALLSGRLLHVHPTPLNPAHYGEIASDLHRLATDYAVSAGARLEALPTSELLLSILLPALALIGAGLVLLMILRERMLRLHRGLTARLPEASGPAIAWWALSLAWIAMSYGGAILILAGLLRLGIIALLDGDLVKSLPFAIFVLVAGGWLGVNLFALRMPEYRLVPVSDTAARTGQRLFSLLGLGLALAFLAEDFTSHVDLFAATDALVLLVPVVLLGLLLLRLQALLSAALRQAAGLDGSGQEGSGEGAGKAEASATRDLFLPTALLKLLQLTRILAIAAPLAALAGYVNGGSWLVTSLALTVFLGAAGLILFTRLLEAAELAINLGRRVTPDTHGDGDVAEPPRQTLLPIFLAILVALAAVPFLALVWGARRSDLQTVWIWLRDGITFGETRISLTDFLVFFMVFVIGYLVTRFLQTFLRSTVLPRTQLDVGGRNAVLAGIGYVGIFLAALAAFSSTGLDLSNLALVAGALSVGIGFGLQTIVSNFVSGIILLIERPIKEGDWIEVAGFSGTVKAIKVRSTEIQTFDRAEVIVPNQELIAGSVLNWTHSSSLGRVIVPVGVAYGTDVRRVEAILTEIAEAHPLILSYPEPAVLFRAMGASSLDFEIRGFLRDVNNKLSVQSDLNFEIVKRFAEEGIEIPFPQQDVHIRDMPKFGPVPSGDEDPET